MKDMQFSYKQRKTRHQSVSEKKVGSGKLLYLSQSEQSNATAPGFHL